ncbi:MAG: RNA methyltransferase [Nitrospirae bacterium]|nr:MAG: RNA methyltransferase [Nitrospirota bacterium]
MPSVRITSPSNPHIRDIISTLRKGSADGARVFLAEGVHLLEMAVGADADIRELFITDRFRSSPEGAALLGLLSSGGKKIRYTDVSDQVLNKLAETETPQGIAALVAARPLLLTNIALGRSPLLVVLDAIQDPGNLGTIIRTSDAAGVDAVITLPGTCDIYMQKTIRSTAGSIFSMPVIESGPGDLAAFLSSHKIRTAAASADAAVSVFETDLSSPVALVFGNEARGISSEVRAAADMQLKIPLIGGAESLNVASSAAVCIYEAVRQRILSGLIRG